MSIPSFSLKTLAVAVASFSMASVAGAAGLDRSGQDVTAFLQDGTYAEATYTYIDADVTGYDNAAVPNRDTPNNYKQGREIGDIAESYDFFRYGVKTDINDTFSVGVLYDEPFGAAAAYSGSNNFVSGDLNEINSMVSQLTNGKVTNVSQLPTVIRTIGIGAQQAAAAAQTAATAAATAQQAGNVADAQKFAQQAQAYKEKAKELEKQAKDLAGLGAVAGGLADSQNEATQVEVRSYNLTGLVGAKIGDNFQVYGGPALQRVEGEVALRGPAYQTAAGYTARISPDNTLGWVAGVAFMKPEIGLKAALTYRSKIEHNNSIDESMPALDSLPEPVKTAAKRAVATNEAGKIDITTPESYNFDFQTGINRTTLATAKIRYVPWGDFAIVPPMYNGASKLSYGKDGLPLVSYDKDQWQVELGLAKRLTPALAVSGTVGWDSGAGNPTTSLGPIEGYYSVGAGAKYNITPNWAISAGGKYLMFGDSKGVVPTGQVVSNFEDNDGYAFGVKLSYQDK
ncbi:outer membrane protein transport protein [Psychrobacter sp. I-STPA10]|uniref:outer membrane protein transport protein n=1 Tax=Psychrobacter sp. I-STPA10 TaxID=2585769 RepID=UPI001E4D883E|nr:outer membrane protein transport protein [Psychrobacter sp. I-STPA10]